MKLLTHLTGARFSLQRSLLINITLALLVCLLLAITVAVSEFNEHNQEAKAEKLRHEALEVAEHLHLSESGLRLGHAEERLESDTTLFRYSVHDSEGLILLGGEVEDDDDLEFDDDEDQIAYTDSLGRSVIAVPASIGEDHFIVQARQNLIGPDVSLLQQILHEFSEQIGWVFLAAVLIITAAITAARRALTPIRLIADQAEDLRPRQPELRLNSEHSPAEVRPLITAVNGALDRLEAGYHSQKEFSANVAHEIRTPLSVLKSRIERIEPGNMRGELLNDLTRIERIFAQVLNLSRADALSQSDHETIDLARLAADLVADMGEQAVNAGKVLAVTGEDSSMTRGNPQLLQLALRNLVENALLYTPRNSEVEIEVLAAPAGWRVKDRGPGVPEAIRERIFQRFDRGTGAKDKPDGAGIGLSIVQTVATAHQGAVTVEMRVGGGAEFTLTLSQ